jgi:1-acyl-sn-glycerol-3-phosphate acyltransferase
MNEQGPPRPLAAAREKTAKPGPGVGHEPVILPPDTALDRVVSVGLWTAGLAWLASFMSAQMLLMLFLHPRRIDRLARLYTRGQVALTGSRWRAVVHPDIDPGRAYIFFQNHTNHLDHCTAYPATPHFKQGVELEEHFHFPVYGWFMKQRGTIPLRQGSLGDLRELSRRARAEMDRGNSLLVFPEGTRTLTGRLGELQPGMFRVARMLRAAIVPVTVTGMYRVMRKGSYLIRPGHRVTVYCDQPVETAGLGIRDIPQLMERVRSVMSARLDVYWAGADGAG